MKKGFYILIFLLSAAGYGYGQCWQQVSAGSGFSIGLKTDGTLWAWGYNFYGQLGIGNTTNQIVPVQVGSSNDWQMVSAGNNHVHAIKTDGTLWGWGFNGNGQLGTGGYGQFLSPIQIGTDNDWQFISAGMVFSMAIKTDGTLWGWGENASGQVGVPGPLLYLTPQQVGTATNWQTVSARNSTHTLAIKADGTLWAWGENSVGQLGTGDNSNRYSPAQIGTATDWQAVNASYYCSHAIKTDGTLWSWGSNDDGQLGIGNNTDSNIPVQEITLATDWQSVSGGQTQCQATKTDNTLWFWGFGITGDGSTVTNTPEQVGTGNNWQLVTTFWNHTFAQQPGNTSWAWGDNYYGELGDGTTNPSAVALQLTCLNILPVTWLSLTGQMQNGHAIIRWVTASENNTDKYEIEHSSNGITYKIAGSKVAAGSSTSEKQYEFIHLLPPAGKNFYRIKQTDIGGKFTYSAVIALQNNDAKKVIISPNPVKESANIYFSERTAIKTLRLLNASGQTVLTEQTGRGTNHHTLNIGHLFPGLYVLQVQSGSETTSLIIIKE